MFVLENFSRNNQTPYSGIKMQRSHGALSQTPGSISIHSGKISNLDIAGVKKGYSVYVNKLGSKRSNRRQLRYTKYSISTQAAKSFMNPLPHISTSFNILMKP